MTDTILLILALVPCLVIAIVFHEVAHGWTALALGDPTAKEQRRLSFNPVRHVDPIGTLLVPGALAFFGGPIFGWAKPVPVNRRRLDNPRYGMMAVAAAGPVMNLLLGAVGAVVLGLIGANLTEAAEGVLGFAVLALNYFLLINIFLALFNLLPIPPFDGSHIVEGLLPRGLAAQYAKLQQLGMLVIVLLVGVTWAFPEWGLLQRVVLPPVEWLLQKYYALAAAVAGG